MLEKGGHEHGVEESSSTKWLPAQDGEFKMICSDRLSTHTHSRGAAARLSVRDDILKRPGNLHSTSLI